MIESRSIPFFRKPLIPTSEEMEQSKPILESVCDGTPLVDFSLRIQDQSGVSKTFALPARVGQCVLEILGNIARGDGVRLLQIRRELTTHEAAELLNVSRTHLIGLLEKGVISYRMVGSHRRIALMDLLAYKEKTEVRRKEVLDAIAAEAQDLKLYE